MSNVIYEKFDNEHDYQCQKYKDDLGIRSPRQWFLVGTKEDGINLEGRVSVPIRLGSRIVWMEKAWVEWFSGKYSINILYNISSVKGNGSHGVVVVQQWGAFYKNDDDRMIASKERLDKVLKKISV